jgi:hypothetical protein
MSARKDWDVKPVTRKYNGKVRKLWRAIWFDPKSTNKDHKGRKDFATQKEAGDHARKMFELVNRKIDTAGQKLTFTEAFEDYAKGPGRKLSLDSLHGYQGMAARHILPAIGMKTLGELHADPYPMQQLIFDLEDTGLTGTPGAVAKIMRLTWRWAVKRNWVPHNPITGDRCLELKDRPKRKKKVLMTDKQAAALLRAASEREPWERETTFRVKAPIAYLVLFTNLRRAEIAASRWPDYDLEGCVLDLSHNWSRKEGLKTTMKSDAGEREIPLAIELVQVLTLYRKWQERQGWDARDGFALRNEEGGPEDMINRDMLAKRWANLCDQASRLPGGEGLICRYVKSPSSKYPRPVATFSLHKMRHRHISGMARRGLKLLKLQTMAGHANAKTTEGYIHLSPLDTEIVLANQAHAAEMHDGIELPVLLGATTLSPAQAALADEAMAMKAAGVPRQEIAEHFGKTMVAIDKHIRRRKEELGYDLRSQKQIARENRQLAIQDKTRLHERVMELFAAGATVDEVTKQTGVARSTAHRWSQGGGYLNRGGGYLKP